MDHPRRTQSAAGRNDEGRPFFIANMDAEPLEQIERDRDVGLRDQLADDFDDHVVLRRHERQREQQPGQELARHIAANANRRAELQRVNATVTEAQRWKARLSEAKPASSNTRLEMLFEPGRCSAPPALSSGGKSRNGVEYMQRQERGPGRPI